MALGMEDFRKPYFIKYESEATLSRDDKARFDTMNYAYENMPRNWRIEPQPGYNAQNPSIRKDRINLDTETPYVRAR